MIYIDFLTLYSFHLTFYFTRSFLYFPLLLLNHNPLPLKLSNLLEYLITTFNRIPHLLRHIRQFYQLLTSTLDLYFNFIDLILDVLLAHARHFLFSFL